MHKMDTFSLIYNVNMDMLFLTSTEYSFYMNDDLIYGRMKYFVQ